MTHPDQEWAGWSSQRTPVSGFLRWAGPTAPLLEVRTRSEQGQHPPFCINLPVKPLMQVVTETQVHVVSQSKDILKAVLSRCVSSHW